MGCCLASDATDDSRVRAELGRAALSCSLSEELIRANRSCRHMELTLWRCVVTGALRTWGRGVRADLGTRMNPIGIPES